MTHAKPVSASAIEAQYQEVFPYDLNPKGTVFGGVYVAGADKIGALVAEIHTGRLCVIRSIKSAQFFEPARLGDVLIYCASVNHTWRTSLEVGVKVLARRFTSNDLRHVFSAYLTFVALDEHDKPVPVPAALPEGEEQTRRYLEADLRRTHR